MSTNPGLQTRFDLLMMYMHSKSYNCLPVFLKFGTEMPFYNRLDKIISQKNVFNNVLAKPCMCFLPTF